MNPHGPGIQTEFGHFSRGFSFNDLNSEKKGFMHPLLTAMFPVLLLLSFGPARKWHFSEFKMYFTVG